jgi:hypothetical protein
MLISSCSPGRHVNASTTEAGYSPLKEARAARPSLNVHSAQEANRVDTRECNLTPLRRGRALARRQASDADAEVALQLVDVRLLDHPVVGQGTVTSFVERGLL